MLDKKISNAGIWSFLSVLVSKVGTPLTQLVLAHILVPEVFGVIATITMITSFADLFTDAGFQKYIVHAEFANDEECNLVANVAFWSNLILSIIFWIIIFISRNLLSTVVGNSGLGGALSAAAVSIPLTSFSSIQTAIYNRQLKFKELFVLKAGALVIPIITTIPLALLLKSYWSMIIGTLATNLYYAVALTIKSSWKPTLCFSFAKLKEMFSFCGYAMIEQLLGWANLNVGIFLVGIYFSEYYLGLYKTSMATVNQVIDMFTSTVAPVAMASLARMQNDDAAFVRTYYGLLKIVGMIVIPLGVGIFIFRDFFTIILLGPKWLEAADFIGLWSIVRALNLLYGKFSVNVFSAKGKPVYGVISQVLTLVVLVPVVLICAPLGFKQLYIARSLVMIVTIIIQSILLWTVTKISFARITQRAFPCYLSTSVMAVFAMLIKCRCASLAGNAILVAFCIIIYFSTLCLFSDYRSEMKGLISKVSSK